jgi:hypothetical protein
MLEQSHSNIGYSKLLKTKIDYHAQVSINFLDGLMMPFHYYRKIVSLF